MRFSLASLMLVLVSSIQAGQLAGRVTDSSGNPIHDATAFVCTAAVKEGYSVYCPSCYVDCGRSAKTDEAGLWKISDIDSSLTFKVLFVAKGYRPAVLEHLDPEAQVITGVALEKNPEGLQPNQMIKGQVLSSDGAPIKGALVGVVTRNFGGGGYLGPVKGTDELAYSDDDGCFELISEKPIVSVSVEVEASGFADKIFDDVNASGKMNELRMESGTAVRGRLVDHGTPVGNVVVGLVQANREASQFVGEKTTTTDKDGRFVFEHMAPGGKWYLYGAMATLKEKGALPATPFLIDAKDSTCELPDIELCKSYRLAGRVILSDGKAIPPHTKLLIGRRDAWDVLPIELAEDGRFDVVGVPEEEISVSVNVKGYRYSMQNKSYDPSEGFKGQVTEDNHSLIILLEPRTANDSSEARKPTLAGGERKADLPLAGAPAQP